ncbi:MAG: prepilin-type N-terminal cleavage/methylation domain-containing protein [Candidatus Kaiserbacteria bacterium]|nr:prepilin-type N-terminal cleavage/methylation domain-containing protein [Candidatus Kaiserbacteria bacterium]MCB9816825.1 prepilin-type N-terminal cleavage/methylation domain-containing protein [Candidatus Nomurabacteria bacterium]
MLQGGFGLIELMVSISIIVLVAGIVLANQSSFNSAVLLRNQAYEIALTLREVQLNAVSSSGDAGVFRSVMGVYFDSLILNDRYRVFRDGDADYHYSAASEDYGALGRLDKRFEIRTITDSNGNLHNDISVVFERPNFDARFFDGVGEIPAESVQIEVGRVGSADVRVIEVTTSGQIAVI